MDGVLDSSNLFYLLIQDTLEINQQYSQLFKSLDIPHSIDSLCLERMLFQQESEILSDYGHHQHHQQHQQHQQQQQQLSSTIKKISQANPEQREQILSLLNRRDSKVSWYLGQSRVDLPYDRLELRKALSIDDTKLRREYTYAVIKQFDQKAEESNAVRVSNQIRETWFTNNESINPVIVVGRESRAFSNQATLFASSNYIQLTLDIKQTITTMVEIMSEPWFSKEFNLHIAQSIANQQFKIQWASADVEQIQNRLRSVQQHLYAVQGRLKSLLSCTSGNDNLASMTQFQGAIQQLKEVLAIVYQKSTSIVEELQKQAVSRFSEGVHRKLNHSIHKFYNVIYSFLENHYGRSSGRIWNLCYLLEEQLNQAPSYPSSFSVLLQRPSVSGSERFKLNELEPKLEQEELLQKLVRIGGENLYMSPSNHWVIEATDIIEAVPLFIYERTLEVDGKITTVFEVDQEGLEQTIRNLAEYWNKNIQQLILSEHIALARELIILCSNNYQELVGQIEQLLQPPYNLSKENAYRKILLTIDQDINLVTDKIIQVTLLIEQEYDRLAEKVEELIESNWNQSNFITRIDSLRLLLLNDLNFKKNLNSFLNGNIGNNQLPIEKYQYYKFMSMKKQRKMPAFHLLTTEAPGLVEGFIQAVLEEEMTLKNIIEHYKLEGQVQQEMKNYEKELLLVGSKIIKEFNYQPIIDQYCSQLNIDSNRAILRVIADHLPLQKQVAILSVLMELEKVNASLTNQPFSLDSALQSESKLVNQVLQDTKQYSEFYSMGIDHIYQQVKNDKEFRSLNFNTDRTKIETLIIQSKTLAEELNNFIVWESRLFALKELAKKQPELGLMERVAKFNRNHTVLSQTTARRKIISENGLYSQFSNPRFAYSCGATFLKNGDVRPTGIRKRYHFVYGPSRVNLGKDERKSVEIWPQFVGVTDPLCAKHAKDFYSLMNFNPIIRTITAAENLKVSENQWTALVRSIRNVQALFVERLGIGDIEDLAYQFNQRGGLAVASHKESEGYMSGPTAGYCIPKDLLFKLFVVTHQDSRKLSMLGIPVHLHRPLISMMVEISDHQSNFQTSGEWEKWASQQFLSNSPTLLKRFSGDDTLEISKYLKQFIEVTGGVVLLHISKLVQILGSTGVPSPLISWGKDLHSALWSSWAEKKITLGGEQVNRSVVFPMTREIPESGKLALRLNPNAGLPMEEELRVHMFGVYKGDDDQKPPPDVRFAWVMRAFLILSGHYKEVALSLDEEGQLIARLGWLGFNPTSNHPEDIKIRQYLANHFIGNDCQDFDPSNAHHVTIIDKLKQTFPPHTTVGDITITAVPGVDSEDLLGFSAETLTLLGDEATIAADILKSRGISLDQMKANSQLHRKFIEEWIPLSNLPLEEQKLLKQEIGGKIHPLSLRLRGPGDNFLKDLQGQDIVVFSITHPQLLALNPATLRDLMLIGRPNSSLVAHDHVSQGRHRCWFERDVMLWYASCLAIDQNGNRILNWADRKEKGRKSIYKAFGLGNDQYQPLLGTDLREEVYRQEERAIKVFNLLEMITKSSDQTGLDSLVSKINSKLFGSKTLLLDDGQPNELLNFNIQYLDVNNLKNEIEMLIQYEQRVLLANRSKPRDLIIRESLEYIRDHPTIKSLTPMRWLAIGGYLLLNGTTANHQNRILNIIQRAYNILNNNQDHLLLEKDPQISKLIVTQLATSKIQQKDRKGKMFSVKASEDHVEVAVTRRKELVIQSMKNMIAKWRQEGFNSMGSLSDYIKSLLGGKDVLGHNIQFIVTSLITPLEDNIQKLICYINQDDDKSSESVEKINKLIGQIFNLSIRALSAIIVYVLKEKDYKQTVQLLEVVKNLCPKGNEIDTKVWDRLVGSYEEFGLLTNVYQSCGPNDLVQIAKLTTELFSVLLSLEKTGEYLSFDRQEIQDKNVYRSMAEFYAKTIDDHYYEYTPWVLDPKRYPLFSSYYDRVGALKQEHREAQYQLYWSSHRKIYDYMRSFLIKKTSITSQYNPEQLDLLLGHTIVSPMDIESDRIVVQAIGASAPSKYELLWRSYNQLREITFIKNDGFNTPIILPKFNPHLKETIDSMDKVNHTILCAVGRTHFASTLTEGPTIGDNLFITRDGAIINSNNTSALVINDGFFWISENQYYSILKSVCKLDQETIDKRIEMERKQKIIHPKGVYVATKFTKPVLVGSVVTLHHHHLESLISNAGYPATDKSPFLYEMTYNKSLYPLIFNPSSETNVLLPPEIDWLQVETVEPLSQSSTPYEFQEIKKLIIQQIQDRLLPFIKEYPVIIVKGAAESGARNLSRFDFNQDPTTSSEVINNASEFIFNISRSQNVVIQKAIITSPFFWMDESAINRFVERQIADYGVAVELHRHPKDSVYGTLRIILSSGCSPTNNPEELNNPNNWQSSHPISLTSLQIATNVGRQGSLEILNDEMIKPEIRDRFILNLQEAGKNVMASISKFGPKYWSNPTELYGKKFNSYHESFPNIKEFDGLGTPTWWPRYLMLDFIPEPIWIRKDTKQLIQNPKLLDIVMPNKNTGESSVKFIFIDNGEEFEGEIQDIKFWQLEPNVGVGLWTNYWKREIELVSMESPTREINWEKIGQNDQNEKEEYLNRISEYCFDKTQSESLTLPIEIYAGKIKSSNDQLYKSLFPHNNTFCVITGKKTLMNHHFYPFFCSINQHNGEFPLNVVGVHESWINYGGDGSISITRCMVQQNNRILEISIDPGILLLKSCFILELPNDFSNQETNTHLELSNLLSSGVLISNNAKISLERCDDKFWIKSKLKTIEHIKNPEMVLIKTSELLSAEDVFKIVKESSSPGLLENEKNGLILQPRSNTTESEHVEFFHKNEILSVFENLIQRMDESQDEFSDYLLCEYIPPVKRNSTNQPFIVRVNACIGGLTTLAIVEAGDPDEKIISPGLRKSKWQRVSNLVGDLPVPITIGDWKSWSTICQQLREQINLPIVGFDIILSLNGDRYIPTILEANARPGSLIMSEQPQFDENGILIGSTMTSPISLEFWNDTIRKSNLTIHQIISILSKKELAKMILYQRYSQPSPLETDTIIEDRINTLLVLLNNSILNHNFHGDLKCSIATANGRDRVFMGHSDFPGLGGFTINANTQHEIVSIGQIITSENPGSIIISNENPHFSKSIISIDEIIQTFNNQNVLYQQNRWENYIKSLLLYLFKNMDKYKSTDLINLKSSGKSILLHFSNNGLLGLPFSGGLSSSSALTTSAILLLNSLFNWNLTLEEMAQTDFAEYYLGKSGGASDKTTQLFSKKGKISVIGSIPERFIKELTFPNDKIVLLMAESGIPRLNSQLGAKWVEKQIIEGNIKNNSVEKVVEWASSIMKSFGSKVFLETINIIRSNFTHSLEKSKLITGLSSHEIEKVLICFEKETPLLRDLSLGGYIEIVLPELKNNKWKRYLLIYRILKILPEQIEIENITYWVRKSVLYALSELERGEWYQYIELSLKPGGFQRSLPEFDEISDEFFTKFNENAAMRISAAGLGGS
eukprot:gene9325-11432_t